MFSVSREKTLENPYQPTEAPIEDIIEETPNIKTFVLRPRKPIEFQAGQFVQITAPGWGEAPFTPSSSPYEKERLEVTIMQVGMVTSILHNLYPREVIGIRGPYGKGYPLEKFYGKEVVIVGGGVGLAPLRSLLLTLFEQIEKFPRVRLRYGARSPKDLVYKNSLKEWSRRENVEVVTTVDMGDETWTGHVGLVTTILDDLKGNANTVAVVCGPPIMMRFVTLKLLDCNFSSENIFLSLEKNMSCGIGKCGHCMLGKYYVCRDGPVFTYAQIKDLPAIFD